MTNKSTSFKRVALALVAALGFGVISTGPSNAVLSTASSTIALSASSASVAQGDSVSVTATVNFTSTVAYESINVIMNDAAGNTTNIVEEARGLTSDSINVATAAQINTSTNLSPGDWKNNQAARFNVFGSTNPESVVAMSDASSGIGLFIHSNASSTTPTAVQAKVTLVFRAASGATAGAYVYTVVVRSLIAGAATNYSTATFTLTVTEPDTAASAAKSLIWVNASGTPGAAGSSLSTAAMGTPGSGSSLSVDSAVVVSAGTVSNGAQTFTNVGGVWWDPRNAADTNVASPLVSSNVTGSLILNVSGPGFLAAGGSAANYTTRVKSLTLSRAETAVIWSDGTPGTMTITGYIGTTKLTQAVKTVVFFGAATTLTATDTTPVAMGVKALSSNQADSVAVGTAIMTVLAKDAAGNTVRTASMQKDRNFWCISSDTSVASLTTTTTPSDAAAPSTAGFVVATAPGTDGLWSCNVRPLKAGSVTLTFADDSVVANASISAARTYTFAKSVKANTQSGTGTAGFKGKGTITFDKSTYNVGEAATITVTVLNGDGSVPGGILAAGDAIAQSSVFPTLVQNRPFSSVGKSSTGANLGFNDATTSRAGTTIDLAQGTFFGGVETYVVYMPTTAGDVTLTGFTTDGTYDTATAVSVTVKVVDPNAAAIAAAQAAAVAAADAATDAALEAIDAANAATDAANLAAEAADAATVAAEEARDAADAATAAVEALATEVASMMAALKAQITTLARTVAKIAKKVNA